MFCFLPPPPHLLLFPPRKKSAESGLRYAYCAFLSIINYNHFKSLLGRLHRWHSVHVRNSGSPTQSSPSFFYFFRYFPDFRFFVLLQKWEVHNAALCALILSLKSTPLDMGHRHTSGLPRSALCVSVRVGILHAPDLILPKHLAFKHCLCLISQGSSVTKHTMSLKKRQALWRNRVLILLLVIKCPTRNKRRAFKYPNANRHKIFIWRAFPFLPIPKRQGAFHDGCCAPETSFNLSNFLREIVFRDILLFLMMQASKAPSRSFECVWLGTVLCLIENQA